MANVNTENKKPGVMIYFDMLPVLENLRWWQRFALIEAMIYYARDKRIPKFRGALRAVWEMAQPIIDRDDERYRTTMEARKRAGKARGEQITKAAKERKTAKEELSAETADEQHVLSELEVSEQHMLNSEQHMLLSPENSEQHMLLLVGNSEQHKGSKSIQSTISNSQSTISNHQSTISNPQSTILNTQSTVSNSQSPCLSADFGAEPKGPTVEQVREFITREKLWVNPDTFVAHYGSRRWMVDGRPVMDWKALARKWDAKEREKKGKK
jgi:hypothetical protein